MCSRTNILNIIVISAGLISILAGSVYAMAQVTREVPASVTVEVMHGVVAEPLLGPFQDPADGAAGMKVGIARVYDSSTGDNLAVQLEEFQSRVTYDGSCVNILGVRSLNFTSTASNIDNTSGVTALDGIAAPPVATPSNLYHAVARLVGSNQVPCAVTAHLDYLLDDSGNRVLVPDLVLHDLLRGDAKADGVVNLADALFIAQYTVGLRGACTTVVDTSCLHSVNGASVRQDGAFDRKTIADALFIAQHVVGLRDKFYNLVNLEDTSGQSIFTGKGGCLACHTIEGVATGLVGPDLTHIGTDAATRQPGVSARDYITESIRQPEAFVAEGVERAIPGLMTTALTENLSDDEVSALVEFLLTQE